MSGWKGICMARVVILMWLKQAAQNVYRPCIVLVRHVMWKFPSVHAGEIGAVHRPACCC
jgi:hypothetical protein